MLSDFEFWLGPRGFKQPLSPLEVSAAVTFGLPSPRNLPRAITVGGRGGSAAPPPAALAPPPAALTPPPMVAEREGLSCSEHSPDPRPLGTIEHGGGGIRGGRWAPGDAARRRCPGHLLARRQLLAGP